MRKVIADILLIYEILLLIIFSQSRYSYFKYILLTWKHIIIHLNYLVYKDCFEYLQLYYHLLDTVSYRYAKVFYGRCNI